MAEVEREVGDRPGLGVPLTAWLAFVTLVNCWAAFRIGQQIQDSVSHSTFFKYGGGWEVYWAYPTTVPLIVLAVTSAMALAGLLLLWLRLLAGLWVFLAAQAGAAALLIWLGALGPPTLLGIAGAGLTAYLVLQRRGAFR